MTIAAQNPLTSLVATALQTVFPFAFRCDDSATLKVYKDDILLGGGAYTVALNADQTVSPGGTVTLAVGAALNAVVSIERVSPDQQSLSLATYGAFPAKTIELAFDKLVMLLQEFFMTLSRVFRVTRANVSKIASWDLPAPVVGKALGWVASGGQFILGNIDLVVTGFLSQLNTFTRKQTFASTVDEATIRAVAPAYAGGFSAAIEAVGSDTHISCPAVKASTSHSSVVLAQERTADSGIGATFSGQGPSGIGLVGGGQETGALISGEGNGIALDLIAEGSGACIRTECDSPEKNSGHAAEFNDGMVIFTPGLSAGAAQQLPHMRLTPLAADPPAAQLTNGDIWVSGAGAGMHLKVRLNGVTVTLA